MGLPRISGWAKGDRRISPTTIPVLFFLVTILVGAILLRLPTSTTTPISWIDALFTAVSATCVTGLTVVDTGSTFSGWGQGVLLVLIQFGGLGIMTFTTLAMVLTGRRVSLRERSAVGGPLLRDPGRGLKSFLYSVVGTALAIEAVGVLLLWAVAPAQFSGFSGIFHSVSAFCNAGFSLLPTNLEAVRMNVAANLVIMALVILGGLGFVVILEGWAAVWQRGRSQFSEHSRLVLQTSAWLIVGGAVLLFLAEVVHPHGSSARFDQILPSVFQSVSARTAGFNTLAIGSLTNVSLLLLIFLMFVGGGPGSCAGGVKVTTFRVMLAFARARMQGRRQIALHHGVAVDRASVSRAVTLVFFSIALIGLSVLILDFTEGGSVPHPQARGQFLEIFFEAVSAFGTVGLSTGLTNTLSPIGKVVIMVLMFVGRLGPLVLVAALSDMQREIRYSLPETSVNVG